MPGLMPKQWTLSETHPLPGAACRSWRTVRHQVVYVAAEFTHNEIAICGSRLHVHGMQPLVEWDPDPERIIDTEADIHQVETVDAQVVEQMAIRLNRLARNVTGHGNDSCDHVEGGKHDNLMTPGLSCQTRGAWSLFPRPIRGGLPVRRAIAAQISRSVAALR